MEIKKHRTKKDGTPSPSPIAFFDLNEHRQKKDKNIPAFSPSQTKK